MTSMKIRKQGQAAGRHCSTAPASSVVWLLRWNKPDYKAQVIGVFDSRDDLYKFLHSSFPPEEAMSDAFKIEESRHYFFMRIRGKIDREV